jgi:uncharacterized protein DUF3738
MAMPASLLSTFGRGMVKDDTGLEGFYDGPSVLSAVQQQPGLHLEPRKIPVSCFVIDSAQRPGEN